MTNDEKRAKLLEWADVLESGKYTQLRNDWYNDDCHTNLCCLGVACVHFLDKLPDDPVTRIRIPSIFGESFSFTNEFVKMNDSLQLSFPEIAAEIRKKAAAL